MQHLAALSPAVLNVTKKAMYTWDALHFDKGLAKAEKVYLEELLKISDMQEGIDVFLEKRNPVWRGRSVCKLHSMHDAVARHVPDGSSVALCLQLEQMIPFAAGHEIIRQKKRGLRLIGPISEFCSIN